jgi:alkylation response protein AidB-like acyl-CoA dehydrogenase
MAFALCPMLSVGAIEAINHHGSDSAKGNVPAQTVDRRMDRHDEPDRATGGLRCRRAEINRNAARGRHLPDQGTKIFISFGDHDMAGNIVHLVLARTPDAPPGTKGISLFLVPKYRVG